MDLEHHHDLAHEFPELRPRIHQLKLASAEFRRLYREYQAVAKEVYRIEKDIETPSDAFAEELKFRRVWLKDHLHGLLTGRIALAEDVEGELVHGKFPPPVRAAAVARTWALRGYSCHDQRDPPAHERHDVVHEHDSLVTVIEGELEVVLAGACWTLEPGDELAIPRGAVHTIRNTCERPTRWLFGCARV